MSVVNEDMQWVGVTDEDARDRWCPLKAASFSINIALFLTRWH